MSIYQLQKLVQAVNRDPTARQRFFDERDALVAEFKLSPDEQAAATEVDAFKLYELGVHPLLLRPFTIINGMSEPDYIKTIRGEN
jgi:hypothetical protein